MSSPRPSNPPSVGRFAPSPTGPLHFGSLIAALGSFLQARSTGGIWLVRVEDIDPPREVAGSAASILRTLEAFGLEWDGDVLYQSSRLDAYRQAIESLLDSSQAYRCRCTRRIVAAHPGGVYPGSCRLLSVSDNEEHAVRVLTDNRPIAFDDVVQGSQVRRLAAEAGDFVVLRRDGRYAYQLAVTIDDDFQGVTDIVRGCDLLDSSPRQIHLRNVLGLSQPQYAHLPVAQDRSGNKLGKQTGAAALSPGNVAATLFAALAALQQQPPPEMMRASPAEQIEWATKNWDINRLKSISSIKLDDRMAVLGIEHKPVPKQQINR